MGYGDTGAKDKKKAAASAAAEAQKKAAEDAAWEDNDKEISKKAARAKEKEDKADSKLAAKAEKKELEAAEEASASTIKGANKGSQKLTQAELARRQALLAMSKAAPKKSAKSEVVKAPKVEENTNRKTDEVDASGIDAALTALGSDTNDKSKGMKYKDFEAQVIPQIQSENPGLKMSQIKDKAFKMWERSPDNPKNQEK